MIEKEIISYVCILVLGTLLSGCSSYEREQSIAYEYSALYPKISTIWSSPTISVCWERAGNDTEKGWVRDAVLKTWEQESSLIFTGWNTCTASTNSGLHILTDDVWPSTVGLGSELNNVKNGISLNFWFTFKDANGTQPFAACIADSAREGCIRKIAVHEFGHALGFAHEQNRKDTPSTCAEMPQGEDGTATYGSWDLTSVMNYCNPAWNNNGALSQTDIGGAIFYYGAPRSALLKGLGSGRCLAAHGTENGSASQIWDCGSTGDQLWTLNASGVLVGSSSGRCLDVVNFGTANGSPVQLWDCNGTSNQLWKLTTQGTLVGVGSGRCLDVMGYGTANGTSLQLWDCNATTNQIWRTR